MHNLYAIEPKGGGVCKFQPNWAQEQFMRSMWYLNAILKVRQLGFSTLIAVMIGDLLCFNKNRRAGIVDLTLEDAKKKLAKVKLAYERMDDAEVHGEQTAAIGAVVKAGNPLVEDAKTHLKWQNGSVLEIGTSLRGGTFQLLHISELGKIAFKDPKRAKEIMEGATETVGTGGYIISESTHMGGKFGIHYDLCKRAMEHRGALSQLDWRFHFFSWWQHPEYRLEVPDPSMIRSSTREYFEKLEIEEGIDCDDEQQFWYDRKEQTLREGMLKEHPSTPAEAFEAPTKGAIYGKYMTDARAGGRISDFTHDRTAPMFTFWDIGVSDFTAIWLIQPIGREILILDWYENSGHAPAHYVAKVREWDRQYETTIAGHFLPHDAGHREASGQTYVEYLETAGLGAIHVVPRTSDVWIGINKVRDLMPQMRWHLSNCGTAREDDEGVEMPSGIDCIENYHTKEDVAGGIIRETPVHDAYSHSADALRTFGEAFARGMVQAGVAPGRRRKRHKRVVGGLGR